jgi:hypothetical protein
MDCKHVKIYADYALLTNPPQYPWICSICGQEGIDRSLHEDKLSYEEIKKMFKETNNKTKPFFNGYKPPQYFKPKSFE